MDLGLADLAPVDLGLAPVDLAPVDLGLVDRGNGPLLFLFCVVSPILFLFLGPILFLFFLKINIFEHSRDSNSFFS